MKNKIDELFKTNASQGHFTYKDAYWADAEKLLANTPKGGGISSGIIGTVAVAIIGAALLLGFYTSSLTNNSANPETNVAVENAKNEAQKTPLNTLEEIAPENVSRTDRKKIDSKEINEYKNLSQVKTQPKATTSNQSLGESRASIKAKTELQENVVKKEQSQKAATSNVAVTRSTEIANSNTAFVSNKTEDHSTGKPDYESFAGRAKIVVPEIGSNELRTRNTQELARPTHHFEDESPEITQQIDPLPKAFKPSDNFTFALGADYSYLFASRFLSGDNADYINFRTNNEQAQRVTAFGIHATMGYKNWLFNSGIYQTTITEKINYPSTLLVNVGVDNGGWNLNEYWTYKIDSNWVVDSIYAGHWQQDTAWNVIYDSTYIAQWDTVQTEKEDPEIAKNNGAHTLTYVEIPLWFGRSFGAKRFTIDVQGGFAVGFLTATRGARYINQHVNGLVPINDKAQFQQVLFSAMLRAGMRFEIAPRWQASLYPTLRYTLNSAIKQEGISQKYLGYGINLGLSYRF